MPIDQNILDSIQKNDASLTRLRLIGETLTDADVSDLCAACLEGNNTHLVEINLLDNEQIGDQSAEQLAQLPHLKKLNLSNTNITLTGLVALLNSPSIVELYCSQNRKIGESSLTEQAVVYPQTKQMEKLELRHCALNDAIVSRLIGPLNVKILDLSDNQIACEAAPEFIQNKKLWQLSLSGNQIGNDGATQLAKQPSVQYLFLNNNQIGDLGAVALAKNVSCWHLALNSNKIGEAGAIAFSQNQKLGKIELEHNIEIGFALGENIKAQIAKNQLRKTEGRGVFLWKLMMITSDYCNSASQSLLKPLPKELLIYIASFCLLEDTLSIQKTPAQIADCMKYLLSLTKKEERLWEKQTEKKKSSPIFLPALFKKKDKKAAEKQAIGKAILLTETIHSADNHSTFTLSLKPN